MSALGLRPQEVDSVKFAFDLYCCDVNKLDGIHLGNVLRGLNINPNLHQLEELGMQKKEGVKFITTDELIAMYAECKKKVKEYGQYDDFLECLKLYDKEENGKMPLGDLNGFLVTLGERLTDDEVNIVFKDCLPEEDDEGLIDYTPFLKGLCQK